MTVYCGSCIYWKRFSDEDETSYCDHPYTFDIYLDPGVEDALGAAIYTTDKDAVVFTSSLFGCVNGKKDLEER